ncbi:hypothetical protein B0G62_103448 [Paraburkholderia eburnea]|uniref:Lipoprotein n=1 Tax=Paraburkholderia eburnea TaxID=1189126 RepID=A0A2S4MGI8_9BURK|nr:hypothetical protein [Paraburkholderia eburnea]POR53866.1 hypothetical protein B0G62_103448 [Paraburkholderia eburnea]PRZ25834.1 hypothetical protein BX588_102448 [Paraburkholderia eburnea]
MKKRNACLVGLAAGATLLAGCVAQYQNPSACEQEMRARLAHESLGDLSVTHTAVAYRGQRVVIEGQLERGILPVAGAPASGAAAASAASSASAASVATAASATSDTTGKPHASFAAGAPAASAAAVASAAKANEPKPATPVAFIAEKLGLHKASRPQTAAECLYDRSGALTSFHWLAPAALAKTTPASDANAE